jgi:hypothetical protein
MVFTPGACTIKQHGYIMFGKLTDFVIIKCLILSITNTLAYDRIGTLQIRNVFIVQATGVNVLKLLFVVTHSKHFIFFITYSWDQ